MFSLPGCIIINFRNNSKTTIILGNFNAGGIDWKTGLVPNDSPNRLLKEKLIEVISEDAKRTSQGPEHSGFLLLQYAWISSVAICPRLLRPAFLSLVFWTKVFLSSSSGCLTGSWSVWSHAVTPHSTIYHIVFVI